MFHMCKTAVLGLKIDFTEAIVFGANVMKHDWVIVTLSKQI